METEEVDAGKKQDDKEEAEMGKEKDDKEDKKMEEMHEVDGVNPCRWIFPMDINQQNVEGDATLQDKFDFMFVTAEKDTAFDYAIHCTLADFQVQKEMVNIIFTVVLHNLPTYKDEQFATKEDRAEFLDNVTASIYNTTMF
jgi:hypothetical protein